jgi:hypothetical protein
LKSFDYIRIVDPSLVPPPSDDVLEVVLLDMNHGWPNVGHHALVDAVRDLAASIALAEFPEHDPKSPPFTVRVLSFDVRQALAVPSFDASRFRLFIGTGGPGHIDPRRNDGVADYAQGIRENPRWEGPLYELFDSILATPQVALLGVCHTFGVLCRWSGAAEPVLRGPEKGGKSSGLVPNWLSDEALDHPWFSRFAARLPNRQFRVIDNRLFDLIPRNGRFPANMTPLAYEAPRGRRGSNSLTMIEMARDPGEVMPRVFAVNHHPEIIDRLHLMRVLNEKLARGEVSGIWYRERAAALGEQFTSPEAEKSVALTSEFTLLQPLEFHLRRLIEERFSPLAASRSRDSIQ